MKLNMDLETMKVLAARLQDEQPGSVLGDVRQQLQENLKPKARQQLTSQELEAVVDVLVKVVQADQFVFPKDTADRLDAARVKLEGMLQRQQAREQEQHHGKRGQ